MQEFPTTVAVDSPSESLVRFTRRSMTALLGVVLFLGATTLAMTLWPDGLASAFMARASVVLPIAIVILVVSLRATLGGRRWDPRTPEARAVLDDELRQASLYRASRAALIVVLIAQLPLGLLFGMVAQLPPARAALGMAEATMTLGLATAISLFLHFDRG
jgi:hypothetical protein